MSKVLEFSLIGVIVVAIIVYIVIIIHMYQSKNFIFKSKQRVPLKGGVPLTGGSRVMTSTEIAQINAALASLKT